MQPIPSETDRSFVALDLETTGLFAATDRIVEVGAVWFDAGGKELDTFECLVHPGRPMSPAAQAIHGISDAMLADASPASEVLPRFLDWLGHAEATALLAHNARFDAGFLGSELARIGRPIPAWPVHDTLDLARRRLPTAPNHRLDTLARMFQLDESLAHRALADSRRVKGLWLALADDRMPIAYRLYVVGAARTPGPAGWDDLDLAITRGATVRIEYNGGTQGPGPRLITPRRWLHKGGVTYLVAFCHRDDYEKCFRVDRLRSYEIVS